MRTEADVNVMGRYNTTSPTPYDQIRPTLLNPAKEAPYVSDSESIPSPCTSPPQVRRHYGESITSLGKASIMGEPGIHGGFIQYNIVHLVNFVCLRTTVRNVKNKMKEYLWWRPAACAQCVPIFSQSNTSCLHCLYCSKASSGHRARAKQINRSN